MLWHVHFMTHWKERKSYISNAYDWEGVIIISQRDEILPLEENITGFIEGDRHNSPPSLNDQVTMSYWLQRQDEGLHVA